MIKLKQNVKAGTIQEDGYGNEFVDLCAKHAIEYSSHSQTEFIADDGKYPDRCAIRKCSNKATVHVDLISAQ